jgi:hypothetical protein
MPKKAVRNHGTQGGDQSNTEFYKKLENYKTLTIVDDALNQSIKELYDNNIWGLKTKFENLKTY